MENSSILYLVISASISFAIGRTVVHFRGKRREARDQLARNKALRAQSEGAPEPESKNKGKRRRQLQQMEKTINKR